MSSFLWARNRSTALNAGVSIISTRYAANGVSKMVSAVDDRPVAELFRNPRAVLPHPIKLLASYIEEICVRRLPWAASSHASTKKFTCFGCSDNLGYFDRRGYLCRL
jgi:hypothetical protein